MEQNLEGRDQYTSISKILLESQRAAHASALIGRETLEKLNKQEEDIEKVQDTLEANDYVLGKSLTALRSMTWGGYVYNSCVTISNTLKNAPSSLVAVEPNSSGKIIATEVAVDTNYERALYAAEKNTGKPADLETAPSNTVNKMNEEEEKQLEDISSMVAQLHDISITMGEQLNRQNKALETIEELTEKVTDKSLYVTLRATQLSTRVKGKNEQVFIGKFQFIDCVRGKFLSVQTPAPLPSSSLSSTSSSFPLSNTPPTSLSLNSSTTTAGVDDVLVLKSVPDRATFFNCFASSDGVRNIFGIQNEKTLKFVGCTMWGTVRCAASYFGTQEECFMDFSGEETGLLLLARNWGSGGWMKHPGSNDESDHHTSRFDEHTVRFSSTTSSIHDKQNIVLFRAVPEELCVRMR